ncbi:50S ribosomal protein L22 [bacterium]|nr:50S ribosomal protein L22 [bacterium]
MEVRAVTKWVRTGPRKVRRYADLIRGKDLAAARAILGVQSSPAAQVLRKTLDSAAANAENNHDLDAEDLKVSQTFVDGGFNIPRIRTRARGRADRISKRTCHVTVVLSDGE